MIFTFFFNSFKTSSKCKQKRYNSDKNTVKEKTVHPYGFSFHRKIKNCLKQNRFTRHRSDHDQSDNARCLRQNLHHSVRINLFYVFCTAREYLKRSIVTAQIVQIIQMQEGKSMVQARFLHWQVQLQVRLQQHAIRPE